MQMCVNRLPFLLIMGCTLHGVGTLGITRPLRDQNQVNIHTDIDNRSSQDLRTRSPRFDITRQEDILSPKLHRDMTYRIRNDGRRHRFRKPYSQTRRNANTRRSRTEKGLSRKKWPIQSFSGSRRHPSTGLDLPQKSGRTREEYYGSRYPSRRRPDSSREAITSAGLVAPRKEIPRGHPHPGYANIQSEAPVISGDHRTSQYTRRDYPRRAMDDEPFSTQIPAPHSSFRNHQTPTGRPYPLESTSDGPSHENQQNRDTGEAIQDDSASSYGVKTPLDGTVHDGYDPIPPPTDNSMTAEESLRTRDEPTRHREGYSNGYNGGIRQTDFEDLRGNAIGFNQNEVIETPEWCCGRELPFDPEAAQATGGFSRVAAAGSIRVVEVPKPDVDILPPVPVRDLEASSLGDHSVNLTWTTPGDDLDFGTVSHYIIRMSDNRFDLREKYFDEAPNDTLLEIEDLVEVPDVLQRAGTRVTVNVNTDYNIRQRVQEGQQYYVALRAVDDYGNVSPVSNVAAFILPEVASRNGLYSRRFPVRTLPPVENEALSPPRPSGGYQPPTESTTEVTSSSQNHEEESRHSDVIATPPNDDVITPNYDVINGLFNQDVITDSPILDVTTVSPSSDIISVPATPPLLEETENNNNNTNNNKKRRTRKRKKERRGKKRERKIRKRKDKKRTSREDEEPYIPDTSVFSQILNSINSEIEYWRNS